MMVYIVKLDGMKVRKFENVKYRSVSEWAKKYCRGGKVEIVRMVECNGLPRASSKIYPNLDISGLRYKPFVSLG